LPKDIFETKKQTGSKFIKKKEKTRIYWTAELPSQDVSKLQKKNRNYYSTSVLTPPSHLTVVNTELDGLHLMHKHPHSALSFSYPCSCTKTVFCSSSCSCDLIKNTSK